MDAMQPAAPHPVRDRLRAEAELSQLSRGDDPVLAAGDTVGFLPQVDATST